MFVCKKKPFLDIDLKITYRLPSAIHKFVSNLFKSNKNIEELPNLICFRDRDYNSVEIWPIEDTKSINDIFWPTPDKFFNLETSEQNLAEKIARYIRISLDSKQYICSQKRQIQSRDFMILVQKKNGAKHIFE